MEELLKKLIEKGWKPFGWKDIKRVNNEGWFVCFVHESKKRPWLSEVSHRELVSKESGLWQFVYDYELIETFDKRRQHLNEEGLKDNVYFDYNYRYRLIESALKDESELESFILDNIKIDG